MTFSMTTGSSVSVSTTLATATDETQTLDSYATQQTLLDSSISGASSDPVTLLVGGEASAVGENTLATGSMTADMYDAGSMTVVSGSASFDAMATGDDLAFATASGYAIASGLDSFISIGGTTEIMHQGPDGTSAYATSNTAVYGLDLDSGGSGPVSEPLQPPDDTELLLSDYDAPDSSMALDGNVAIMDVSANVPGDNTVLDVVVSVLTVEDTLSTVSGQIIAVME